MMKLEAQIIVDKPIEEVWSVITDFKNCAEFIHGITKIEVLEEPENTLLGFKWKETRVMFGKEATEIMWITDFVENKFYQTKAESHGSIYISRLEIKRIDKQTQLTMSFAAEAQTLFAKIFTGLMGFLIKGSMKKAVLKDLSDIKTHLEGK